MVSLAKAEAIFSLVGSSALEKIEPISKPIETGETMKSPEANLFATCLEEFSRNCKPSLNSSEYFVAFKIRCSHDKKDWII